MNLRDVAFKVDDPAHIAEISKLLRSQGETMFPWLERADLDFLDWDYYCITYHGLGQWGGRRMDREWSNTITIINTGDLFNEL